MAMSRRIFNLLALGSIFSSTSFVTSFHAITSHARIARCNPSPRRKTATVLIVHAANNQDDSVDPTTSAIGDSPSLSLADVTAQDVVTKCMDAMLFNDSPYDNAGLEICFDYSSDRCRASLGGSLQEFISYASNPTFGSMTNAHEYSILSIGPIIPASLTRGAMQTVLVKVKPQKGDERRFLWTLQQERRPPRQGLWLVHECIYVENALELTM